MFENVLDKATNKAQGSSFLGNLLERVKTEFDKASLATALEKRGRQNVRRLKNWTGARYGKVEAAD
jgi:hypothetical protein